MWSSLGLSVAAAVIVMAAWAAGDPAEAAKGEGAGPVPSETSRQTDRGQESIQGNRTIIGIVRKISGDQIEVHIGEVHPRYLPLIQAKEKGMQSIQPGDKLRIVVNDQNLLVDFHPLDQKSDHRLVEGRIAEPLVVGHDEAVIRRENGQEEMYRVRPLARSKMASIPVGTEVLVLLDETDQIADVTSTKQALEEQKSAATIKSPLKGAQERVAGTIVERLQADRIRIKTDEGQDLRFEVRPLAREKLAGVNEGQTVVLLVDGDRKVVDVAVPPQSR